MEAEKETPKAAADSPDYGVKVSTRVQSEDCPVVQVDVPNCKIWLADGLATAMQPLAKALESHYHHITNQLTMVFSLNKGMTERTFAEELYEWIPIYMEVQKKREQELEERRDEDVNKNSSGWHVFS